MTGNTKVVRVEPQTKGTILATAVFLTFLTSAVGLASATGVMLVSDTNPGLAVNAYGGAANGTVLKLVNNCTANISDCTWTYRDGMLLSDTDPTLAINAYGGAKNGTVLKLVNNCSPSITDCTWSYHHGMWVSDSNPNLAVNAYGEQRTVQC